MTTLSKKMLGYALGRTVRGSDRPLIETHDGARGRCVVFRSGDRHREQPSVPQPCSGGDRRRPCRRHASKGDRTPRHQGQVINEQVRDVAPPVTTSLSARHGRCAGAAVDGVPAGVRTSGRSRENEHAAAAARDRLLLERRRADRVVGEGQRREHGAGACGAADDAASRGHGLHPGTLQPDGGCVDEPSSRPDEPAVGRIGQSRPERDPGRHLHGSDPGVADRRAHRGPQPRARDRTERAQARGRPVDDLRLQPVLGLADQASDEGDLSVARRSIA